MSGGATLHQIEITALVKVNTLVIWTDLSISPSVYGKNPAINVPMRGGPKIPSSMPLEHAFITDYPTHAGMPDTCLEQALCDACIASFD